MASADRLTRALKDALKRPENRRCADCQEKAPSYCQLEFRTFVCATCAAVHREVFSASKIKSVGMATFTTDEVKAMRAGGNELARKKWMANWTSDDMEEPPAGSHRGEIQLFLEEKYLRKRWTGVGGAATTTTTTTAATTAATTRNPPPMPPRPAPAPAAPPPMPASAPTTTTEKPKIQISVKAVAGTSSSTAPRLAPPTKPLAALRIGPPKKLDHPKLEPESKEEPPLGPRDDEVDFFSAEAAVVAPQPPQAEADPFAAAVAPPPPPQQEDLFAAAAAEAIAPPQTHAQPPQQEDLFAAAAEAPPQTHAQPPQQEDLFAASATAAVESTNPFAAVATQPMPPATNPFGDFQQPTGLPPPTALPSAMQFQPPPRQLGGGLFAANEVAVLDGPKKLEKVTVVSVAGPRATVRDRENAQRDVEASQLIKIAPGPPTFAPNDRALYEIGSRVEKCRIVEVHQDAPDEPPYYTVKLVSTGKQRTTEVDHLHKPATVDAAAGDARGPMSPPPSSRAGKGRDDDDGDPFSDLVGETNSDFTPPPPHKQQLRDDVFVVDERVSYAVKGSNTDPEPAIILKVHYDDKRIPYYTIRLLSTGAERETGASRLKKIGGASSQQTSPPPGGQHFRQSPGGHQQSPGGHHQQQQQQRQGNPYGGGYAPQYQQHQYPQQPQQMQWPQQQQQQQPYPHQQHQMPGGFQMPGQQYPQQQQQQQQMPGAFPGQQMPGMMPAMAPQQIPGMMQQIPGQQQPYGAPRYPPF